MRRSALLSSLAGRFVHGVFWNLVGTLFAQGSVFLTAIILARLLGKEVFGEFGMIQSTLLTLTSIAQISTGLTATKYVAEFRDADKARAGRVLGLCSVLTLVTGVVATALLLISAPWVAEHILAAPHLAVSLSISAAFVLFSVMNGYQIGALAGLESYKSISVYGALLGAAHLALCGLGAMLWGLHGALGGMAMSALLRWGVYGLALHHEIAKHGITIQRRHGLGEREILHRFALPAALSGLTAMPAIWFGNALLVQQPNGYAEMGLYSAANNARALMLMMPVLLNSVGVAVLNNAFGNKDKSGFFGLSSANIKASAILALVGAGLMVALSGAIPKWYGMEVTVDSNKLIVILSLAILFEALAVSYYQLIQASEKMWVSFFLVALPRDLSMIGLSMAFIPMWGGVGLAVAYSVSWAIALLLIIAIVFRLGIQPSFLSLRKK
jgi:O-antigen/teichoic acid export membrane protein